MSKADSVYIDHIQNSIKAILAYTKGITLNDFLKDNKTQDAVIRQFEIIGEAVKRISDSTRPNHPEISWDDMAEMRDKLIHDYIDVDLEIVWKTVEQDVPILKDQLNKLL